jgi:hypothetical protein
VTAAAAARAIVVCIGLIAVKQPLFDLLVAMSECFVSVKN